jgi:hypothetical protein
MTAPTYRRGAMNDSNPLMIAAVSGVSFVPTQQSHEITQVADTLGVTNAPTQISTLHFSIAHAPGFGASSYNASCH